MTTIISGRATHGSGVAKLLQRQAREHGPRPAIHERGREISYADLHEAVARRAANFDGLGADAVLLFQPQRNIDSLITVLAGMVSQAVILIADPAWGSNEVNGVIANCAVTHRVDRHGQATPVVGPQRGPAARPGGVSFGRFTSGSTGSSRCLGFSDRTALAAAETWAAAAALGPADRVACCAAFHNGLAFNTSLLSVLGVGAELLLPGDRLLPSNLVRLIETHGATRLVAFPFFLDLVVQQGKQQNFHQLRQIVSSADRLQPGTAAALRDVSSVCDYYGLAEVGPCTYNDAERPGSVGHPLPGASIRIIPVTEAGPAGAGRVAVRTGWMAEGYLDGDPHEWAAHFSDGHYLTSDLGRLTGGFLVLEGRVGTIVNVGGRKIDPTEIEEALRLIDGVTYACVFPVHVHGRSALAAFIESASLSRADILRSLSGKLANYKIPSAIRITAKLPRGEAGKVSRERLLAEFQEG